MRSTAVKQLSILLISLFVLEAVVGSSALGAPAGGGGTASLSLLAGITKPSGTSPAFTYGAEGIYRLGPKYAAGAFYQKYSLGIEMAATDSNSAFKVDTGTSYYGGEGLIYLGGNFTNAALGLKLGLASTSTTTTIAGVDTATDKSGFFVAPKLAYEKPTGMFSLGGEIDYIIGLGDIPGGICVLANGRIWF